jgi:hypothetical protein
LEREEENAAGPRATAAAGDVEERCQQDVALQEALGHRHDSDDGARAGERLWHRASRVNEGERELRRPSRKDKGEVNGPRKETTIGLNLATDLECSTVAPSK